MHVLDFNDQWDLDDRWVQSGIENLRPEVERAVGERHPTVLHVTWALGAALADPGAALKGSVLPPLLLLAAGAASSCSAPLTPPTRRRPGRVVALG